MKFYSTRNKTEAVSFKDAIFRGLAPDGGLYMPENAPDLSELINSFTPDTPFNEIAASITQALLSEELDEAAAKRICDRAFDFIPELVGVDDNISIMELFHGPSCAFKDFGASFLASSMEEFLRTDSRKATILTATSGDTGSAVARAFYEKENIDVIILYPSGRVSPLQEKQLTTLGKNIRALEVEGSFDDCQRMVKEAFLDRELSDKLNLTSANSISLGRLIPQSFYYIWAWAQAAADSDNADRSNLWFCVPSGNFGNLTAGIMAHSWGMGNRGFIAATNINDVVPEYLKSGEYNPRASKLTLSNAMDVGNPSNFERMLELFEESHEKMSDLIKEKVITDSETAETIRELLSDKNYECDPHTAVGYLASKRFLESADAVEIDGKAPRIISLSTAHPGKFTEVFDEATGKKPELPARLEKVLKLEKVSTVVGNTLEEMKAVIS
ncbi:MAG: threonine synthase [Spirochaetales bacterium]|uniref:Threonine synthase n=1 Tax=Candidatus Thalassospirochaeta sargassi TaxID=3119039 RepID=A0AAJ1IBL6_9SPIO|nr:threonine synthase [Spirochaetales bacterium]